jgi:ubiquinone/menaquinone biosynthesis C-methylase UbiE
MSSMSPVSAFDSLAASYDELWTASPTGRAQRDQVWRVVDRLFRRGDALLDIGCGTGEDAAHFAARGVKVHATDDSREMIRVAARRGGFTTAVMRAEDLDGERAGYDGAISDFGALNCVADLPDVAKRIGAVVRPGGRVAICVIGRFCLWETLYYMARLQFGKALRRLRQRSVVSSLGVRVHYQTVRELRAAFAPHFRCERWVGIGLLAPPSYVALPGWLVGGLAALDRIFAHLPLLRGMADHRLLILLREPVREPVRE